MLIFSGMKNSSIFEIVLNIYFRTLCSLNQIQTVNRVRAELSDPDVELTVEWTVEWTEGKIADNADGVDDKDDNNEDIFRIYLCSLSEIIKYLTEDD